MCCKKEKTILKFHKLTKVKSPEYATENSAGIDFFIPDNYEGIYLPPNRSVLIKSGIKVSIPDGKMLIAFNKSGIACKKNIIVGACVVDSDYQGEIGINLINVGKNFEKIQPCDKIVQFILMDKPSVTLLECEDGSSLYSNETKRGEGGFGSTGNK